MFRTELTIAPQERQLARTARVLTVGSCFADSIGTRLRLNKVNALVNPFGTVFQPLALAQLLRAAAGEEQDWQQHVVEARGRWQSYDFHSTIGAESPVELLQLIQETVRRVGEFVRTADTVVLTLGTAWAYRLRETGELVSNLHKLPASLFEKELLTADEIVNGLAEVHALLRRANPDIRIVLTVSPVRHLKDTLPLNAVSKSVLRVACHYLSELLPGVSYFPAYELLTDELRDYRFYASDMLHPSEVAEDYIWDKFARAYFDADFGRFRKEWAAVRQSLGHRPLHLGAPEHRSFLDQTVERLERLSSQGVDVRQELRDVQRQLVALPPPKPARVVELAPEDDEERIDIGDNMPSTLSAAASPGDEPIIQAAERRNDSRRDGRRSDRNNRTGQDRRNGRPAQPGAAAAAEIVAPAALPLVDETVAAAADALLSNPEASLLAPAENAAYPAKKKKRRSRGGAKRTARKHAARLAADQTGENSEEETDDRATQELAQEIAHEAAGVLADANALGDATPGEAPLISPSPVEVSLENDAVTVVADAASPATEPTIRKRGTGPTPKKSKVITKSGLVGRGPKRNALYRNPTPAEKAAAEAATASAAPATAPIISPPLMPVALLERPAVLDTMVPSQAEPEAPNLSQLPAADAGPAAATTPRRGRPKAAPSTTPEATTVVAAEVALTPVFPEGLVAPEVAEPAAAPDAVSTVSPVSKPKDAKAPAAKKAATSKATPKKAAPKKAAVKKPAAKKAPAKRAAPPATDAPAA
ncbi:GSCFA domain-containing protein [Hymenobacter cheonanensis]|uniref:GSCFA domain-containing protein n=1 Tax=Hymenobacter sp. CA2-7 TaxID=3063993 RepID=UPI002713DED1|nr:GSCFA domain-containing protein [Hymenobacter sp. CA2-7]MDO7885415.1 GSCFA domain-containing protein [Hymenobacter sp. CA2-7]